VIAPPSTLRLSAQERAWLTWLKTRTGARSYAPLLRFALVLSLAEPRAPHPQALPADGLEVDWATLGGQHGEIYWACVVECTTRHGLPAEEAPRQLRAHLYRGIGLLRSDRRVGDAASAAARTAPLFADVEPAPAVDGLEPEGDET